MKSVHFCGNMGIEKLEIYNRTTVGVVNPSARTETFGLSAVEMEACGIPVVTKSGNGFFRYSKESGNEVSCQKQIYAMKKNS